MDAAELLLNPNLAYLLLVIGGLLAILALFTPGTGVLEVGALFILILAGWMVYNLPINAWALVLMVLGVVPFILALRKSQRQIFLVLAILAFVVGSSFMFRGDTWWQPAVNPVLAGVVSIATAGFMWFTAVKVMDADRRQPSHDLASLVGVTGETRTPVEDEGTAQIGSELWTVRSTRRIPANTKVQVVGREGFVLMVEEIKKNE